MAEAEEIMGTVVSVDVRDRGPGLEAAAHAVFDWLHAVDATFSTYRRDSDVCRLERGEVTLEQCAPDVGRVLSRCEALRRETGGAFDARATGALDPSALVKGWAVERGARLLEARGVRRYCVNGGGDVRVGDGPRPGEAWRVGIRHPLAASRIAAVVEVTAAGVATSGTYERGAHVVDPRTGRAPAGVLSMTVVGPDLGTADAYATAAFVMGRSGVHWLARRPDYAGMAIHDDGTMVCTPAFDALRAA